MTKLRVEIWGLIAYLGLLAACGQAAQQPAATSLPPTNEATAPASPPSQSPASPAPASSPPAPRPTASPATSPSPSPVAKVAAPGEVIINDLVFQPQELAVGIGETVTWVNRDKPPHTTASKSTKEWESPILETGGQFKYTFNKPGTYDYWCTIHPDMLGTITVR